MCHRHEPARPGWQTTEEEEPQVNHATQKASGKSKKPVPPPVQKHELSKELQKTLAINTMINVLQGLGVKNAGLLKANGEVGPQMRAAIDEVKESDHAENFAIVTYGLAALAGVDVKARIGEYPENEWGDGHDNFVNWLAGTDWPE